VLKVSYSLALGKGSWRAMRSFQFNLP